MARPIWTGTISFGLVTVPIELYSATVDHSIRFHQLERGTSNRIRYRMVNEQTGKEVPREDIVKGYEVSKDDYVIVEPGELDDIAPGRSRTIDIENFVELNEVDPIFFERTYLLAPAKQEFDRPYGLLAKAMEKTGKAGIAKFVMHGNEHIAAVRARGAFLALDILHFAEDIREPGKDLSARIRKTSPRGKELDMAVSLIDSMSGEWDPADYTDTYADRVEQLIADKQAGRKVTRAAEPEESAKVVDLYEALEKSVRGRRGKNGKTDTPRPAEMSKTDLLAMARELDIKGRSTMSRAELEKAVTPRRAAKAS